jgi:hypothetical protein
VQLYAEPCRLARGSAICASVGIRELPVASCSCTAPGHQLHSIASLACRASTSEHTTSIQRVWDTRCNVNVWALHAEPPKCCVQLAGCKEGFQSLCTAVQNA